MSVTNAADFSDLSAASGAATTLAHAKAAILAGLQTGDGALAGGLSHISNDGVVALRLLSSIATGVGQNVDARV